MVKPTTTEVFEKRVTSHAPERYVLCLYVTGLTPRSTLVKESPSPTQLFIGDLTDEKKLLHGLKITS